MCLKEGTSRIHIFKWLIKNLPELLFFYLFILTLEKYKCVCLIVCALENSN